MSCQRYIGLTCPVVFTGGKSGATTDVTNTGGREYMHHARTGLGD